MLSRAHLLVSDTVAKHGTEANKAAKRETEKKRILRCGMIQVLADQLEVLEELQELQEECCCCCARQSKSSSLQSPLCYFKSRSTPNGQLRVARRRHVGTSRTVWDSFKLRRGGAVHDVGSYHFENNNISRSKMLLISKSTAVAAIVVALALSATANASADEPPECKGMLKRLNSGTPHNKLEEEQAICDGPWRLGINAQHQFGLWKDGFGLYELFATGAKELEVTESENGTESYLTVFGMAEGDIVWEVACFGQSNATTAKLIVTNATHIVRFAEEERLWSYEEDGSNNLDSRCSIVMNNNVPPPEDSDDTPSTRPVAMPTKEPTGSDDTPSATPVISAPTSAPTKEPTAVDESKEEDDDDGIYDCESRNPCGVEEYISANKFYFPAQSQSQYIQCGLTKAMCFVRDCGPGTIWIQDQLVCGWAGLNVYISLLCSAGIDSMCEYGK